MSLNGNTPYTKEKLASHNRGGFFAEGDLAHRIMTSRYVLGLKAVAKLEMDESVRNLMAGEAKEMLERTADQQKPIEQLPKQPIVPPPAPETSKKMYSPEDIEILRERIDTLSESRTIQMPPEAVIGTSNEDLSRVA